MGQKRERVKHYASYVRENFQPELREEEEEEKVGVKSEGNEE